jgi:hypothetical protein
LTARSIESSIDVERLLHTPGDDKGLDAEAQGWHAGTLKYRGTTAEGERDVSFLVEARVPVLVVAWHKTLKEAVGVSMHRCFCGEFGTL